MIEKKTVIDQIEIRRDGSIGVRFGLLLIEDGVEINCHWHRVTVEPGGDIDEHIAAVEADITSRPTLRAAPISRDRVPLVKSIAQIVHTPDVVRDFARKKELVLAEAALTTAASPSKPG